eukprot:COSAG06_NODE_33119_length_495_cov_0.646465_1_plen_39_part_10
MEHHRRENKRLDIDITSLHLLIIIIRYRIIQHSSLYLGR